MDKGQFLLYQTPDGDSQIEVKLQNDTVWLSLDQMAELFQRNKSTISRHVKNVLEDGELEKKSVVAFFATTASDSKTYSVAYYNLDMIISVGYRVHSKEINSVAEKIHHIFHFRRNSHIINTIKAGR